MEAMPLDEAEMEREIQELQKQRRLEEGRLASFGTGVSYDSKIYGDTPQDEYAASIGVGDEEPDYETSMREKAQSLRKLTGNYTAPKNIGKDIPKGDYDDDPFTEFKSKKIIDREDDYKKRRLKRKLSPTRETNAYRERMQETLLEKEHDRVVRLAEKKKEEQKKERETKLKEEKERIKAELEQKQKEEKKRRREEKKKKKKEERRKKRAKRNGEEKEKGEENEKDEKKGTEEREKSWSEEDSEEDEEEERERARRAAGNLVHTEPADAKKPSKRYVLHVFKSGQIFGAPEVVHKKTCYRFGKDESISDIVTAHDSCSKQHAVLQWREVKTPEKTEVRGYLIDYSTNGTFVNDKRIKPRVEVELKEGDALKFAFSTRQYVLQEEKIKL